MSVTSVTCASQVAKCTDSSAYALQAARWW